MPDRRRKGSKTKTAQAVNFDRSNRGQKPGFTNPELRAEIMAMAPLLTPRDISRRLGRAVRSISDWLNIGEGRPDNEYAQFYTDFYRYRTDGRHMLLTKMIEIGIEKQDWKALDRVLARTDEEMQYVDRDRVAGRNETHITLGPGGAVTSGAPSLADLHAYIAEKNQAALASGIGVEGEVVDGEYRELAVENDD